MAYYTKAKAVMTNTWTSTATMPRAFYPNNNSGRYIDSNNSSSFDHCEKAKSATAFSIRRGPERAILAPTALHGAVY